MKTDAGTIVVDAGPLIHLDELSALDLLADTGSLIAPEAVWQEACKHRPELEEGQIPGLDIASGTPQMSARLAALAETLSLDLGEIDALALAEHRRYRTFLTDDSAARLAGESMGLQVHGTIGVIVRAIRRRLRTREQVLEILSSTPEKSTLHISKNLLAEVIIGVRSPGRSQSK